MTAKWQKQEREKPLKCKNRREKRGGEKGGRRRGGKEMEQPTGKIDSMKLKLLERGDSDDVQRRERDRNA